MSSIKGIFKSCEWKEPTGKVDYHKKLVDELVHKMAHKQAQIMDSAILGRFQHGGVIECPIFKPPKYKLNRKILIL